MAEDGEAKAKAKTEQVRLELSSMDLNSDHFPVHQNLSTISEEREVFYDEDGLVCHINVGFDSVVVVDNLPVVAGEEGVQKLETNIREIFGAFGVIKNDGFSMPVNPRTLETLGHCYIEFTTRQEAELAAESIDGYKYGSSMLSVTLYDDLHKFVDISPEQTTLDFESYKTEKREEDGTKTTQNEDEDEDRGKGEDEDKSEAEGYDTRSISEEEMES